MEKLGKLNEKWKERKNSNKPELQHGSGALCLVCWGQEWQRLGSRAAVGAQRGAESEARAYRGLWSSVWGACVPLAAVSFLRGAGSFVSGKDILIFHFSGKEQRQFLCRDLILDVSAVPRLAQAIALGNRSVCGNERNEKLALERAAITSKRLWGDTGKGKQSPGKTLRGKFLWWPM